MNIYTIFSTQNGKITTFQSENDHNAYYKFLDWLDYHSFSGSKEYYYRRGDL